MEQFDWSRHLWYIIIANKITGFTKSYTLTLHDVTWLLHALDHVAQLAIFYIVSQFGLILYCYSDYCEDEDSILLKGLKVEEYK